MKKIVFLLVAFFAFVTANSQVLDPVKWKSKTEKISETEYNLVLEATIDSGWHLYSQFTPDGGPIPLSFAFVPAKGVYELVGKTKESTYKKHFNDVFGVDEFFFEKKAKFIQKVTIGSAEGATIKAEIDYQVCKEVCINLNKSFQFVIPAVTSGAVLPVKNDTLVADTRTVAES